MKWIVIWAISIWWPYLFSCESQQASYNGEIRLTVYRVVDGDSFEGRASGQNYKIRLFGIDAPEKGQDFYRKSKDRLGELCKDGPLLIKLKNKDYFGRWVADAYTSKGIFINQAMVREGFAWHFTKYSKDSTLHRLEKVARASKSGLWEFNNPTPPWEFRKNKNAH
jgi:endonuclease YncB( thermonuclease family)